MIKLTHIIFIFISFIFASCNFDGGELQKDKINPYSISLGAYKTYEQASKFKMKLGDSVRAHLRLESVGKKKYKLFYGKFSSAYAAGEKAFDLYRKSLIKDYEINRNGQRVLDEFMNVPFLGNYLGKGAVYNYNLKTKSTEILWSRSNRKVLSLNLSRDSRFAFIVAAENLIEHGNVTSIQNARVYFLHRNEDEIDELMNIGNMNQLYTYWDQQDTFRVNATFPDSNNARIFYQRIFSWDSYGKGDNSTERSFDLLLQGFPTNPDRKPELFSPNGEFQVRSGKNDGREYFYLKNFPDKSEVLLASSKGNIRDVRWSADSRYLFIITAERPFEKKNSTEVIRQELIIYDNVKKKLLAIIDGSGFSNLLVRGKLLFFDERLNGTDQITILDLTNLSKYDSINLYGGCALNNLPN
ncbi:MAG: hypothetical protein WCZ90_04115 [Melioribacteraceae bacterium]